MTSTDIIGRNDANTRAELLTTQEEAVRLYRIAKNNADTPLESAIKRRAELFGWDLTGQTAGDLPQKLHDEAVAIVTAHKSASQGLWPDLTAGRITADYAATTLGTTYTARVDALLARSQKNLDAATKNLDATIASFTTPTGTTEEQLLAEIRATKIWDRIVREKPKDASLTIYLGERVTGATPEELSVILTEAPSWLIAEGLPDAAEALRLRAIQSNDAAAASQRRLTIATKLHHTTIYNAKRLHDRVSTVAPSYDVEPRGAEFQNLAYVNPAEIAL